MWQFPWKYKESIAIVGGIILIGFLIQYFTGLFDFYMLQWPVNGVLGLGILLFVFIGGLQSNNKFFNWMSGVPLSVTLIATLLLLSIIMGLTPQGSGPFSYDSDIFSKLGFRQMTSSYPFIFVYFLLLLSLGVLIVRRLKTFRLRDYPFYLNHIGLWILLFASGLGAADMKRYVMYVQEGDTEWRVYNQKGDILDLPFSIRLNDFIMEEYPPQLIMIDRETGDVLSNGKPEQIQLDVKPVRGRLREWNIEVKEYIHEAVRSSDSTYLAISMPGSTPAVEVKAIHQSSGEIREGWVCGGNTAQLFKVLPLSDKLSLSMTRPDPKRFISDINVFTPDGKERHLLLEVNKPYKIGNWMIYQSGYDSDAGKMSSYSSIELVYDPWIIPVYIGILFFAMGSFCMLWMGNRKKGESE